MTRKKPITIRSITLITFLSAASALFAVDVTFSRPTYSARLGETLPVEVVLSEVPSSGLSSFGVQLSFDPNRAEVSGAGFINVSPTLSTDGPRSDTPFIAVGKGFAAAKAMTPFSQSPKPHTNGVLVTFFVKSLSIEPFELHLSFFNTLGPTEQIFIDGEGRVLDPQIRFGIASVQPAALELLIKSGPILNRQTGLFEQVVTVRNNGGTALMAANILIHDLPASWQVWNAVGTADGLPYLVLNSPLAAGASIDVRVEFRIPNRTPTQWPNYSIEETSPSTFPKPTGEFSSVTPRFRFPDGSFLLEFNTLAQRWYSIQYSRDLSNWVTVAPSLLGNGSRSQWIDSGPPKTDKLPSEEFNRYYRVFLSP